MFISLAEVPSKIMGGGEERHYFLFHERAPQLPMEVIITRLPPLYGADKNWHKHEYVEEFSVPLTGSIEICEKKGKKVEKRRHISGAILQEAEWVVGIRCNSDKELVLIIDSVSGTRREQKVVFDPKFTEGADWHLVQNPTDSMVTMVTMKRVQRKFSKKIRWFFGWIEHRHWRKDKYGGNC